MNASRKPGSRVFTNVIRPEKALIEQFRGIPASNIGDMMGRLYCMDSSIRPLNNALLLGCAFTVKAPCGDNMMFHRALDLAQPGDILVVDGQGCMERSLAGEIMMEYAINRGLAGVVVNGCMRDFDAIREMTIPVYCKGITPQGPYKHGPGEINVPVCCGGQVVLPGDILVGDADSLVVIRREDAEEVLAMSKKKLATEDAILKNYRQGIVDYAAHEALYAKKMEQDGFLYLNK